MRFRPAPSLGIRATERQARIAVGILPCALVAFALLWIYSDLIGRELSELVVALQIVIYHYVGYTQYIFIPDFVSTYTPDKVIQFPFYLNLPHFEPWTLVEAVLFAGLIAQFMAIFAVREGSQRGRLLTCCAAAEAYRQKVSAFLTALFSFFLKDLLLPERDFALIAARLEERPVLRKRSGLLIFYRIGSATYA